MYGVPADLPIQRFVGDALFQIGIGVDGVHFVFGHAGTISALGRWELHDAAGQLIDCAKDHAERDAYRLHVILNEDVASVDLDPPKSFSLTFANGHRLTLIDDTPPYESIAIYPDDIYI